MKKLLLIFIELVFCLSALHAQQDNDTKFSSVDDIRNYLESNILSIDPIEGEYDVQFEYKTNSPFAADGNDNFSCFIIKNQVSNNYDFYFDSDYPARLRLKQMRIEQIGTTNVYRLYWGESSNRVALENNIHFIAKINLTSEDAKTYAYNSNFTYQLILEFDCIKKYPTTDMYINAAKKANEDINSINSNGRDLTYNYPSISKKIDQSLTLKSVVLKSNETLLVISCKNDLFDGWMNINKNAYIIANGSKYKLIGVEGIAYSPNYTYFSYKGQSKTFVLHFPAIPKGTKSIDFIETPTSDWRLYGISLQ